MEGRCGEAGGVLRIGAGEAVGRLAWPPRARGSGRKSKTRQDRPQRVLEHLANEPLPANVCDARHINRHGQG